jgi:hypothetical protein
MKNTIFFSVLAFFLVLTAQAQNRETRNVGSFTKIAFRVPGKLYLKQGSPQKVEIEGDKEVLQKIETEVDGNKLVIEQEGNKWFNWGSEGDNIKIYITVPSIEALSVSGSGELVGQSRFTANNLDLNVSGSGELTIDVDATGKLDADVSGSGDIIVKGKCNSFDSDVSGSGKIELEATVAGKANFEISGSGKIHAKGSAQNVEAEISGSGKVLAANLETERCEIKITGSGDVEINVKNELDANISGSGTVSYKGNPSKVNSHASGSGSVRKL